MPVGSGTFHEFFSNASWEDAKPYLIEELEQLHAATGAQWGSAFTVDGTINATVVSGTSAVDTVYVSNEGPHHKPKWARVNLLNGVKNRLQLANFAQANPLTVLGRTTGTGNYQSTTLDVDDLTINATPELEFSARAKAAVALQLHAACGGL